MSQTQNANERLAALTAAGTSVWLDQISRSMIDTGDLRKLIDEDSLRGMTSNPAIFEKAILGSEEYDEQIEQLAKDGADARAIYREVAIRDVQEAADVLRSVYDETGGYDGYVSLEVDPDLAHETDKTIEQAREYWKAVDRPNLMIKIPGTTEGVPAIETAISEGINVNVTLLFSVESYANVAEAFIKGLETRHAKGESVDIHSVASFFVSRVDSEVDKRLGDDHKEIHGIAGLANARAAYMRFKEIFHGDRFAELKAAGAPVQRPLWASTGVKNPDYSPTMYVDGLVAPETVNTMPMDTLRATGESAEITGATADQDPSDDLKKLADAGIDMEDVTKQLLDEGIDKFITPMDGLIGGVETERLSFLGYEAKLTVEQEKAVGTPLIRAHREELVDRIWKKDDTVWGEAGQPEVSNRLGWLDIAERIEASELTEFADSVIADGITDVVLLGMGGSSLAPEVFWKTFGKSDEHLTLHLLDSTDAAAVRDTGDAVDLDTTLFLVSTKSGGTIETLSAFKHFWSLKADGSHYAAITDPGSSLVELAEEHGFRKTFINDENIGGRYSALSYFGLVPAALIGAAVGAILDSAREAGKQHKDTDRSPGLYLGGALGGLASEGRDKATLVLDAPFTSLGLWTEQLVAESTGKQGKGILPVADEPLGSPDGYGDDRVFLYFRVDGSHDAELDALADAGHPVFVFDEPDDPSTIGAIMFGLEFAIAVAGWALDINPFDQPNVQEAKDNTKKVLDSGDVPTVDGADDDALKELLSTEPPHYVAIMAYTEPDDDVDVAVTELRTLIRERTKQTTTFGYGPRFLHSTGQLHKGGPKTGRFLQLVADVSQDVEVPGEDFTFEKLKHAQAAGDLQTLAAHELPSARINIPGDDVAGGVRELTRRLGGLL